tara:strand:+ start:426 stop:1028 length:603 start_codon:yes stop_codon:yes gene_type:complete
VETSKVTFDIPKNFDSLKETIDISNLILIDAVNNAKNQFHTPIVSSIDGNKIVSRVMVLREFDLKKKIMRFHTDNRAAKIRSFQKNNTATVIGYDPNLKVQIKLQGNINVHIDDSQTLSAWDGSTARSKKCYSVKDGSTQQINNPETHDIKDFNVEEGYKNFAVLIFSFYSLEFLYLKSSGHRRSIHDWQDDYKSSWLVP